MNVITKSVKDTFFTVLFALILLCAVIPLVAFLILVIKSPLLGLGMIVGWAIGYVIVRLFT